MIRRAAHSPFRRRRQTKIVSTLGPASSDETMIRALFEAGADVFRLNFSHGSHEDHGRRLKIIRALEIEFGRPIAVLADLQGPKLRLGKFAKGRIDLHPNHKLRLDLDPTPGDERRVNLPHPEIIVAMNVGDDLLLDDGRIRLRITEKGPDYLDTVLIAGKELSDRKGVNVPGVILPLSPLTTKDREDLNFALDAGVDWIALSFVQRPEDVAEARRLIGNRKVALMSKLEKPAAIANADALIEMSDGIMLARGDLGVELPPEDLPSLQKRIVRKVRAAGKPIIVATQMLESMVHAPTPTRAEATDVANAVYDGTDAVMLSAETASGEYPIEAITIMDRIIRRVETDPLYRSIMDAEHPDPKRTPADAITAAAHQVANTISAAAICTYTTSGSTTLRASRERPGVPIICLTEFQETARRLVLSYGVHAVQTPDVQTLTEMVEKACRIASEDGFARDGQRLVITAGMPFGTPGATNVLRIAWVGG